MENKKVGLSVDSAAMQSGLGRLKKQAESMASEMIKNSRAFSTSSKEVLKDIDEQIKSLEKRNSLMKVQREAQIKSSFQSGSITESQYKARIGGSKSAAESSSLSVKLLKEIIDGIKTTSKNEIRSDRQTVEKQIKASKTVGQLSPKGSAASILKETVQRGILGDVKSNEFTEKSNFNGKFANGINGATNAVGGVAGSSNASMALMSGFSAGGAALGGLIGARGGAITTALTGLISSVTQKALSTATGYQVSRGKQYGATGGGFGYGFGLDQYGYTVTEAQDERLNTARNIGHGSDKEATNSLLLKRAFTLSSGDLGGSARLTRDDSSGRSYKDIILGAAGSMQGLGIAGKKGTDFSLMPEYLKVLTELGTQQVSLLGETNTSINEEVVAKIASLDESFKNPEVLGHVVKSLQGGLSKSSSPQVEALQYSVLSGLKPGASFFELQKMKENPFSKESEGYLPGFLKNLKGISGGGGDMFYQNIMETFGTSATIAEKIGQGYEGGNLKDVVRKYKGNLFGRAGESTGELASQTAGFSNEFASSGDKLSTLLKDLSDKIDLDKILDYNEKILTGLLDGVGFLEDLIDLIKGNHQETLVTSESIMLNNQARGITPTSIAGVSQEQILQDLADYLNNNTH